MKDTGGPAFPHSRLGSDADGMTLRDYFAAKAMQAHLNGSYGAHKIGVAEWAYAMADAMLKERNNGQA